ncbi:MAG: hypothetical protein KBT69_15390, partial [Oceanihabitans sp.]|nr:hypothetical protein [Oceanihabitans sp.]
MKKLVLVVLLLSAIIVLAFPFKPVKKIVAKVEAIVVGPSLINKDSVTIKGRVETPDTYKRVNYPDGSFQEYLRNYKLKPFGSKIINYDDSEYFWQDGHIGILEIPVPKNG